MVSMRIRSTRPSIRSDDAVLHAGETRLAEHSDLYRGPQRIYSATRGRKLRWSPCASVQLAQVSDRMTPFFTPAKHDWPNIPIYIAGLNEYILRLAGESCDGLHAHPFNSPKYLAEYVLPNVEKGLKKSGRDRKNFTIATIAFAIVGHNKEEQEKVRAQVRQQISFYASTRTYRIVLETHGWGPVADRLNEKAAKGEWAAMANEITDEMLDVYSVTGTWDDIGDKLKKRYEGLLDRVAFYMPYQAGKNEAEWRKLN